MALVQHLLRLARHARLEGFERRQDLLHRLVQGEGPMDFPHRGVQIVAPQPLDAEPFGLEPKEALEDRRFLATHIEQRLNHLVRQIVPQVAHRQRRGEAAEIDVLVGPVAHQRLVELAEHVALGGIDPQQFAVGGRPQLGAGIGPVGLQLAARQLSRFTVDFDLEGVAVGEGVVDPHQRVPAGDVLQVDDALFRLAQGVGRFAAQIEQPLPVVAGAGQERLGASLGQTLPPQGEEQRAVADLGGDLVGPAAHRLRQRILGIFGETQVGEAQVAAHPSLQFVEGLQDLEHFLRSQIVVQARALGFEASQRFLRSPRRRPCRLPIPIRETGRSGPTARGHTP